VTARTAVHLCHLRHLRLGVAAVWLTASAAAARPFDSTQGTEPRLVNGTLERHAATSNLARDIQTLASRMPEPEWIAYSVPVVEGGHTMCDWTTGARSMASPAPVHLEPPMVFFVFYRVDERQIVRIRSYSVDCPLDAGGKAVQWLTGVLAADSVAHLRTFVTPTAPNKVSEGALSAIAMHAGRPAIDALISFARDNTSSRVRGSALLWLSQRAGQQAVGAIAEAIERDPDTEVKRKAVFALSQLPKDQGVPLLIDTARTNKNPAVRKQAMFWLGQSRDPRALKFFEEILK
jgi:hypothetical protein